MITSITQPILYDSVAFQASSAPYSIAIPATVPQYLSKSCSFWEHLSREVSNI
ncbi:MULTISPECIES: hypothetical protein [unclassified Coleofasciculus]|uniref:hypothetical protein n=1 Tax=unclassified Coleofasciculus TaxID=2692782 RepID=UPI00187F87B8|nr:MULTISPECIES: hypothetical protein [unclassified Coleofasciculus]MBE9126034.1 hypothetical protein [Coleofasciculus sp. LEGE 07081]MBE9148722.1 hypothetical protein [Coleofasciculus sp. LEGE 07092]